MKTMQRYGIVCGALAAVLLITAALITSCPAGDTPGYTLADGKGAVKLNLADEVGRTILPGTAIGDFAVFNVDFTPNPTGTAANANYLNNGDLATPIVLDPGTYILTVIGYLTSAAEVADEGAAIYENTSVTITAGVTSTLTVTLKPYDPVTYAGESGTFEWNMDISGITGQPASITSAEMVLTPIVVGVGTTDTVTLIGNWVSSQSVDVGYYYVDITLIANGITANFRHVLHIYQNMTSSLDYVFTDNYFTVSVTGIRLTLAYELEDIKPILTVSGAAAADGSTHTLSISADPPNPATRPVMVTNDTDFSAFSWWCGSERGTSTPNFTINTALPPFNVPNTYLLTVIGTATDGKMYSTTINITILP